MDSEKLSVFFDHMKSHAAHFYDYTGDNPKLLVINPEVIAKLSRLDGFYHRPEVKNAEITAHAPVVRRFNLTFGTVELYEDYEEKLYHFE